MLVDLECNIKVTPKVIDDLSLVVALLSERLPEGTVVVEHSDHAVATWVTEVDC